ncbi:MAG: RNA polymerase sporulation sigma factor SigK [Anaerobutyricum sp.]|nr:RNA polymerase sporulation sigma factor SigK [Eubacterium sp.]MDY6047551.1 RNA polymerase sporulation sigma factor SigK [Anaerobutyricum sp.]
MRSFKKPLKAEEEKYYLKMYRNGDETAKEKLIEHNLRLVAHIVKKYNSQDRDLDDLISIGTIGLIKAVNTFDENKGGRLVTYAARCIENELLMMLRQEKKLLREVSLYEPIGTDPEGNHISLLDIICTDEATMIEQFLHQYYLNHLDEMIGYLEEEREQEIIIKRYGLRGNRPQTQKEVAASMGISRSYVSRIEKRALEKLKSCCDQKL